MNDTIQIGNLGYSIDDRDLARLFAPYGTVLSARVCTHDESGESTGAGFVEMQFTQERDAAVAALHGQLHCGRLLSVSASSQRPAPESLPAEMFGPMNTAAKASARDVSPERRGLP